eukprot:1682281-Prymnesium_polylepis.1
MVRTSSHRSPSTCACACFSSAKEACNSFGCSSSFEVAKYSARNSENLTSCVCASVDSRRRAR